MEEKNIPKEITIRYLFDINNNNKCDESCPQLQMLAGDGDLTCLLFGKTILNHNRLIDCTRLKFQTNNEEGKKNE